MSIADQSWVTETPTLYAAPREILHRVFESSPDWSALDGNPVASGRFSLNGTHKMFYVASHLEGALWEVVLRYTAVDPHGKWDIPTSKLKGQMLAKLRLTKHDVKVLALERPRLLTLVKDGDGDLAQHIKLMTITPDHKTTHAQARRLHDDLAALTPPVTKMPILSWTSRQFEQSKVYLAYDPAVSSDHWTLTETPIALDSIQGLELIRTALKNAGIDWTPLNTLPTTEELDTIE